MKLRKYTKEWLEELCAESYTYNEVLRKAGRKLGGGNQSYLKKKIDEFNIDVSHFKKQGWSKDLTHNIDSRIRKAYKYNLDEIFIENSPVVRKIIRDYVVKFNLLEYKCVMCGNTGEWLGQKISLELDHINGINNDHRLENLRWLCPNCHALTETYAGKNNKK